MMIDATVTLKTTAGERTVALGEYLEPADEEAAHRDAHSWIKQLRHAKVEGRGFRQRFTVRGDSLWWFTEIYLHKQGALVDIHRTIRATRALLANEQPSQLHVASGSFIVRHVVPLVAKTSGLNVTGGVPEGEWNGRLRRLQWRARMLVLAAWASRLRTRTEAEGDSPVVAAFIHRAFWRLGGDDGSAESYIGPVLQAIEERCGTDGIRYVGVGPPVNFRARQWSKSFRSAAGDRVVAIERYAPWRVLRDSREVWRNSAANFHVLCESEDLRAAAVIGRIDCWPIVREQLAGVVFLQWPWSARAMDEAAAALDTLRPSSVLTYAEAGGWGRALMLESRRRGIPSAGLQHGFIYRQWLNYLHEPDEMERGGWGDAGFPAPTITLLFDEFAARHLREQGRLPPASLKVTGSPRLDVLIARLSQLTAEDLARARAEAGARDDEMIVLVTTKEKEARHVLPAFVSAAAAVPGVRLVIKPHPAETAAAYEAVAGQPGVTVMPAETPLAPLLAASRAVVTVNSTVALDAAVAGIPALVIGLPNNLSPFVDAGALAGAHTKEEIADQLRRVLYDEGFRLQLAAARSEFLGIHGINSDGKAAARSAVAVLALTPKGPRTTD
jgi:hypothetical protein